MAVNGAEIDPAVPSRSSRIGLHNLNLATSQFATRAGKVVGGQRDDRPVQQRQVRNELDHVQQPRSPPYRQLPYPPELQWSETNRSLSPTHSDTQNAQFWTASIVTATRVNDQAERRLRRVIRTEAR